MGWGERYDPIRVPLELDGAVLADAVSAGPSRIRLERRAGWRLPEGARSVARPHKWGNPFPIAGVVNVTLLEEHSEGGWTSEAVALVPLERRLAVELYRSWVLATHGLPAIRAELAGLDLACWCSLEDLCHADVLLELANGEADRG